MHKKNYKAIDTHAHIYDKAFEGARDEMFINNEAKGIKAICMPNIDLHTLEPMLKIAQKYPMCKPMVGLHPCHVNDDFREVLDRMAKWLSWHNFIAVGEIGLDLYRNTNLTEQKEALKIQLGWAVEHNLPVSLHCRESIDEVIKVLVEVKKQHPSLKGVLHCFTGNYKQARQVIDLGFYLGIGGIVTFKNNTLQDLLLLIDLKNILVETDSPYLAPTPHRGKRNEPSFLTFVIEHIAYIKKISVEEVAQVTTYHAERLFGLV